MKRIWVDKVLDLIRIAADRTYLHTLQSVIAVICFQFLREYDYLRTTKPNKRVSLNKRVLDERNFWTENRSKIGTNKFLGRPTKKELPGIFVANMTTSGPPNPISEYG